MAMGHMTYGLPYELNCFKMLLETLQKHAPFILVSYCIILHHCISLLYALCEYIIVLYILGADSKDSDSMRF